MPNWLERTRLALPVPPKPNVPLRFETATGFDAIPKGPLRDLSAKYVTNFMELAAEGRAPLFLGRAGTYKTTAASVIAHQITLNHRIRVSFQSAPELALSTDLDRFSDTTRNRLSAICTLPFVVMDDFAAVEKGFGLQVLQYIALERFDNLRPTLWTGNLSMTEGKEAEELALLYGPLLARRILQGATGYTVFTG